MLKQHARRKGTSVNQPLKEVNQDLPLALSPSPFSVWPWSHSFSVSQLCCCNQCQWAAALHLQLHTSYMLHLQTPHPRIRATSNRGAWLDAYIKSGLAYIKRKRFPPTRLDSLWAGCTRITHLSTPLSNRSNGCRIWHTVFTWLWKSTLEMFLESMTK